MGIRYISTVTHYYSGPEYFGDWTEEMKSLFNFEEDLTGDYDNINNGKEDFPFWFEREILDKWKESANYQKLCDLLKGKTDTYIEVSFFETFGEDDLLGFEMEFKIYLEENEDGSGELVSDLDTDRYYVHKGLAYYNYKLYDNGESEDDWIDPNSPDDYNIEYDYLKRIIDVNKIDKTETQT